MIVKGIEVERHNLSSIGLSSLRDIQATLAHNVGQLWGDVTEEKLLMKLISIEIKRKVKVKNINLAAKKQTERTIKKWDTIERQSEPLKLLPRSEYYAHITVFNEEMGNCKGNELKSVKKDQKRLYRKI